MFWNLAVDSAGTGYTLSATAGTLTGASSRPFDISPLEGAPVYVRLQSDAGDYIGTGHTYGYTQASAVITVTATGNHLSVRVEGAQQWVGEFQAPSGLSQLEPGEYTDLQRYPFHAPAQGGLSWSGEGRGCNTLLGSFAIDSITYDADILTAIDLRFEQHCEGGTPALRGTIHWRSGDTTAPPGPVLPVPAGLWRPAPGATPTVGDYVYLKSDSGDFIGAGRTYTYTPGNSTITVTTAGNQLGISVSGAESWGGGFRTMINLSELQPGFYSDLWRLSFHNLVKGGFGWSGEARGCNTSLSWVAIDRVVYASSTVTGLDLRFQQRCEWGTPALHGAIHWDR